MLYLSESDIQKITVRSHFEYQFNALPRELNPPFNRYIHCESFTELSDLWRMGADVPDTPQKEIDDLRNIFLSMHPTVRRNAVLDVWEKTEERFMKNPGFAAYYARFCMHSEWYPRWPLNVPTARAVVGPFGYGWDLEGNFGRIPVLDDHAWWSKHHPVLKFIRERAKNTARIIEAQHDLLAKSGTLSGRKQRICVLSAGYIPWLTMLKDPKVDSTTQAILACDIDPLINKAVLRKSFGKTSVKPISEYLTCRNEDLLKAEKFKGYFDAVLMDGGFIYYPPAYRQTLIDAAINLLQKGGVFVYDDQCRHWAMDFATSLFGWGIDQPIYLADNYAEIEKTTHDYANANPRIYRPIIIPILTYANTSEIIGASIVLTKI